MACFSLSFATLSSARALLPIGELVPFAPLTSAPTGITDTYGTASIPKGGSGASEGEHAEDWADTESGAAGARGRHEGCVGANEDREVGWGNYDRAEEIGSVEAEGASPTTDVVHGGWDGIGLQGAVEGSLALLTRPRLVYAVLPPIL